MERVLRGVADEVGDAVRAERLTGERPVLLRCEAHEDALPGMRLGRADERRGQSGDALRGTASGRVGERHGGVVGNSAMVSSVRASP
jgi:hypothetical protein